MVRVNVLFNDDVYLYIYIIYLNLQSGLKFDTRRPEGLGCLGIYIHLGP